MTNQKIEGPRMLEIRNLHATVNSYSGMKK